MEKLDIVRIERGTPVVLHGRFGEVRPDGRVMIYANGHEVFMPIRAAESRLEKVDEPKYDTTRLFKKGDKVRVVEWNGRKSLRDGKIGKVLADEIDGCVELSIDGWPRDVYYHACMLDLVTPVEEMEKWHVYHDKAVSAFVVKTENHMETASVIFYGHGIRTEKEAEKAAEAERDRLNAEWRKEEV